MPILALFWDYDNTILETAEAHWKKHCHVLALQGIELKEAHRQRVYENNGNQNWQWMHDELGLNVPRKEYLEAIDAEFQHHLLSLEMRSGVREIFSMAIELKIPQAIVTNARRDSAEPVLKEKKIDSLMKFALFKEDYEGRKPDPAPYLAALKKMEAVLGATLNPKDCLAIEDDPKGVESAHLAGLTVIHRKLHEEDPASPYADYSCFQERDFIKIVTHLLK
jgi:HAD superfamily hydrolase (TIGR01509 family)